MQWEITKLEKELSELDEIRMFKVPEPVNNGAFEWDDDQRKDCLDRFLERLKEYSNMIGSRDDTKVMSRADDFVDKYSNLRVRREASKKSKANVQAWLSDFPGAIDSDEAEFIKHQYIDLMDVVVHPRTPLRQLLENLGVSKFTSLSTLFRRTDADLPDSIRDGTVHYAEENIVAFIGGLMCVAGFAMIIVPLWILFALGERKKAQLIVITFSIGTFLLAVQGVSAKVRPFESLAATAAYSAVHMVFMQIGSCSDDD